ncbi:hypothetical protein JYU34_008419 [Plutella xylostella]|uniref:RHD domain-containing protein n=1 Tax=Plutella xylostella TaxID=51655 RepID=A0ABQ7QKV7_PLUXY|nr:hypothetical protein JYU34_008419 [Plutella xylostella]
MDIGEGVPPATQVDQNDEEQRSNINISDVLEAIIITDPSFGPGVDDMYRPAAAAAAPPPDRPYVRILEQPASKALRFRYECEGRSAGSIPGASSTPEKKTFPAIEICGHKGRAIVVVSCVTKDAPHRPHPHNLVGRELCKKGVCTMNAPADSAVVTFTNLGIQCVKRRDIEDALAVREEMRVDPFKTGFSHKNSPQSIDLNAVRLCFQVFLPDERSGKIRHALPPVVSDVIYDKKAMSDLVITRLSHCSAPAQGGKQVILLCEKVAREDITVTFFEKSGERVTWQADAADVFVHKQVAICFTTPPYRDPHVQDHVQAYIQLRRPTDNATSEPLPFELLPSSAGTVRRKPPPDLSLLTLLLQDPKRDPNNNQHTDSVVSSTSDTTEELANGMDVTETIVVEDNNAKSLNELLDQVAELDEIYSENRTRLETVSQLQHSTDTEMEDFNDAGTYSSLQLAFKNPVEIAEPEPMAYEPVHTFRSPVIEFSPLKRDDDDDEPAPPLPPKRRKTPSVDGFKTSQTSVDSILKPGRSIPITRQVDRSELSVARSEPALPALPKKRSFLSRLFRRKDKSPAPSIKSEGKREKKSKSVGRSVSSVSGIRPSKLKTSVSHASLKDGTASAANLSYADSITHISLHADDNEKSPVLSSNANLPGMPPTDGATILVAESVLALDATAFKKLQDDLDLTDAEHYALYMAVAPHATASEFDETSCYYSPVDGSKFHN